MSARFMVAMMAIVACSRSSAPEPAPAARAVAPPDGPVGASIVVTTVSGRLERRQGDAWTRIERGARLADSDIVRTADLASATIAISDHVEVRLGGTRASELHLATPIRLADGLLTAEIRPGGGLFTATFAGGEAVAETSDGSFSAITDGGGGVTVASTRGTTHLTANGRAVDLPTNTQSTVIGTMGPTSPVAVPSSLFLRIKAGARGGNASINGLTTPGAMVSIDGVVLGVSADGTFRYEVPASQRRIRVDAEDVVGHHRSEEISTDPGGTPRPTVTGTVTF